MPIAVAIIRDPQDRLLLVRKHGTAAFMQPGGKIEFDEDASGALSRELAEELGIAVKPDQLRYVGSAEALAVNEIGVTVAAEIFELRVAEPLTAQAEIAEAVWVDPASPCRLTLAPLTRDHIFPLALVLA